MHDFDPIIRISRSRAVFVAFGLLLPTTLLLSAAALPPATKRVRTSKPGVAAPGFDKTVAPFVNKYCVVCHTGKAAQASIDLSKDHDALAVLKNRKTWESVGRNISDMHMPPPNMPQPTQAEREKVTLWLDSLYTKADCALNDPGRVTLHRLNREEYNNTVRDLLGVERVKLANGQEGRPADDFPNDDVGYGFDNIGDVLSLSPLLMEKYVSTAEKIAMKAIITPEQAAAPAHLDLASAPSTTSGAAVGTLGRALYSTGEVTTSFEAQRSGQYTLRTVAYEDHAGPEFAKLEFRVDGKAIQTVDVNAGRNAPKTIDIKVDLSAGKHKLGYGFTNDYYDKSAPEDKKKARDRNLFIVSADVISPPGLPDNLPASHTRILFCKPGAGLTPEQAARKILTPLAEFASTDGLCAPKR